MIPYETIVYYKTRIMKQILQKVSRISPIVECRICSNTIYNPNLNNFCSYKCRLSWENEFFGCRPR